MNVFLTFDIEVWCNGWDDLDGSFPGSFERYVYGHSADGDYALPQTLAILNKHGLKGVFFVEPLFATRFGAEHLATIVRLIRGAGKRSNCTCTRSGRTRPLNRSLTTAPPSDNT